MALADLLRETLDVACDEVWENERTSTPVWVFGVRLHSMGLSVRAIASVSELLGADRFYVAVWNWTHDLAKSQADRSAAEPSRVVVAEKQIEVDDDKKWLYAAIDTESKLLPEIDAYSHGGTDPAAAFFYWLTEHDVTDAEFLVDAGGYLTALFRYELSSQLDYEERNHTEKWFQTVSMRIDRIHSFWQGSQSSARRWLRRFRHHYNHDRPNQALDYQTPAKQL